jgi:hypothetical protein
MAPKNIPREASLLRSCERILREKNIVFRKRHGTIYGVAGDPDLYLCWQGKHAEIELKRPGEKPTPLQQIRMREWARAGAIVGVVHTPDELRNFLDNLYTSD